MPVRAIRGATTVESNSHDEIINETKELLLKIVEENNIVQEDIISIIFSVTRDLDAAFPAVAARQLGWTSIALMCTNEIDVPGSIKKCIRVLMHINTEKRNSDIRHIYLKGAKVLRPDLAK
ncbi:MAG TPA: chorismate mutase [Clostridiaceae bacterium]|nr:chorismate mutase [Clostridiaceae bacterium]